jgi:DNA (cytosine-5)-methyltransferase 1
MSTQPSHITVTDQFCGAGGSSQGVRQYAERSGLNTGLEVRLAMNHWKLALETHNTNFPDADHVATDISACNPKHYPTTTILVTSPECTNHSVAKGRKQVNAQMDAFASGKADPAAERSRATMWDVVRFAEYHKYKIVITENVVDARAWELWEPWLMAMHQLGYKHECVFFNSMFAWPTPQSRDRMYVVFWRKGQRKPDLDFRPLAPCPQCGPVNAIQSFKAKASVKAKYGTQYVYVCPSCAKQVMPFYYAAINAIDWTVPAVRIGDREKPLQDRTMQRIEYGMKKYGNKPLSVSTLYGERVACRVKDASESPLFGQHSVNATAIAAPYLVDKGHTHAGDQRARSADAPLRTQAAQDGVGLVTPFVVGTEYDDTKRVKGAHEPLAAQTGRASAGLALPFIMDSSFTKAKGEYMNGADETMGTQTTTQSKSVVIPPALMMSLNYPEQSPKGLGEAMDTQTGSRPMGLAFLAKLRGTDESHVKSTASGMDEPVGTISANGLHHALVSGRAMGFLESHYKTGENVRGLDDAMGALSCRDRHGLVHGDRVALRVEDLYFRMLKSHEVQAGMAFARDYVVLGNSREKVKQLGNAVTPPVMEMIIERCVESLK